VASEVKTKTTQFRRVVDQLESGEVLLVTMLDRLGRASRDLLNTLAAITGKEAAF
jgi:DNA invertase Pin-like site-specific DNA recombinase